jgi:hypothetical protein
MQRIRRTDRGLQLTQGAEILTFAPDRDETGIHAHLRASALDLDGGKSRQFLVEGRDNIRDLGEWFAALDSSTSRTSSFNDYTISAYETVSAVSVRRPEPLNQEDRSELGREIHEATVLATILLGMLEDRGAQSERPAAPLEVDVEAFAYPLGVPTGLTPIMLARQTADRMTLQFDHTHLHEAMPMDAAQQFGQWALDGLDTIQKKSVWG